MRIPFARTLALLLLVCVELAPAGSARAEDDVPNARLLALVGAINAGDSAAILRFGAEHYDSVALAETGGRERLLNRWLEIRETIGPVGVDSVMSSSPAGIQAWVRGQVSRAWLSVRVTLDSLPPHRIVRIGLGRGLRPPYAAARMPDLKPAALPAAIERYLDGLRSADLFSGVVRVEGPDGLTFERAMGVADSSTGRSMSPDTPFDIGSIGKVFTAVAIGRLIEDGRLRLEDSVGRHLPGMPAPVRRITIAQLLEHSSGLGEMGPALDSTMRAARTVSAMLAALTDTSLAFAPGSDFSYSNRGYIVLGRIVEKASGMRYDAFVARQVFKRAGMTKTTLGDPPADRAHRYSHYSTLRSSYRPGARTEFDPRNDLRPGPHGGAYSTARDLARFAKALTDGRLLERETVHLLTTPRSGHPWAKGFQLGSSGFGHGGGTPGMSSLLWVFPEPRYTLVVLSNYDTGANIAAAYLQDLIEVSRRR